MAAQALDQNTLLSNEDLRSMAECTGPCISIYLPLKHSAMDRTLLKAEVHRAQTELTGQHLESGEVDRLLEPLRRLAEELSETTAKTLSIFRSAEVFRTIPLSWEMGELVLVSSDFHIAPLLPLLQKRKQFYILALSQKNLRLLRCTPDASEEIELPASIPRSLDGTIDEWDDMVDKHSPAGFSSGKGKKSVVFGGGASEENKDDILIHFYTAIDRALHAFLKEDPTQIVLAGVDYELAIFHRVSRNPRLVPGGVQGAPDGLKGGELYRRAVEILGQQSDGDLDSALRQYEKQGGRDRVSSDAANILRAAREGRVAHLFLSDASELTDVHNAAALQTLRHSGQVHLVPPERMPGGNSMSALFRF